VGLFIVGAGSVGREALDVAVAAERPVEGFLDDGLAGTVVRGLPVLHPNEVPAGAEFIIGIADPAARRRLVASMTRAGATPANLIHPRCVIAPETVLGSGCLVMAGAHISSSVTIGEHVQVHYNATVGHDTTLADYTSVYPGANVGGAVRLGESSTVGSGACVLQNLTIGESAFIGAGAVVTHHVSPGVTVVGVPARPHQQGRTVLTRPTSRGGRAGLKRQLARVGSDRPASGATVLIYHRVGGGSRDELDTPTAAFEEQIAVLAERDVVSLDTALDRLAAGDASPTVVLTFDDGFADVHAHAWPRLRATGLPFTLYLAAGLIGTSRMAWEGSHVKDAGPALSWDQVSEMAESGLCTVGNHTFNHVEPDKLSPAELDMCSEEIEHRLGYVPRHFAYTWGVEVPDMRGALAERFRSAVTGRLGRNLPGADHMALRRVPVRASDPLPFFKAKLRGKLYPERAYALTVRTAKRAGLRG
jgi:sugar O-acyltransferase (sialic acid O-acetyltransferase NeuD family)